MVTVLPCLLPCLMRRAGTRQKSSVLDLPPMDILIRMSICREVLNCSLALCGIGNFDGGSPGLAENWDNLHERSAAGQSVTAARRKMADRGKLDSFVKGVGFN